MPSDRAIPSNGDAPIEDWIWHCPPARWESTGPLVLWPDARTDFWQRTHYGFTADNGHFLYTEVEQDFVLTAEIQMDPRHRYDQAGLMVRVGPECWIKTSVEFEPDEPAWLGAVVTNHGWSDWSTQPFSGALRAYRLRIHRSGQDYRIEWSPDGESWSQLRIAHLGSVSAAVACGIYACSPTEAGMRAEFRDVSVVPGYRAAP